MASFFKSEVSVQEPEKPAKYSKGKETKTLSQIIADAAPDFKPGARFFVNPLLSSGHFQTAFTALHKFENADPVHYKRRLLHVESDKKFYYAHGDKMPYDRWEGASTFAIDYVVSPEASSSIHQNFRPPSQKEQLPPRTEFLDPEHEYALLDNDRPLVVALHGLSGGSFEPYLRSFMIRVAGPDKKFDGVVLNSRGCAMHTITSPQLFCGLWTNDLRYLINEHITKKWPGKKIFLIGFSLGGSIVANYLGQEAWEVNKNIKGAAIMGSPWDFCQSAIVLSGSYLGDKVYSPVMCQNLLKLVNQHYDDSLHMEAIIAEYKKHPEAFVLRRLRDFDDCFTSRLFGFNCATEYYRHASPSQRLLNVRVPTIIINSNDDPVVGGTSLPYSEVHLNPYTYMVVTSIGGHLGWFDYKNQRWYAEPLARLFDEWSTWDVEDISEDSLPRATHGTWKHDRIVS